jgi:hypothetical protein
MLSLPRTAAHRIVTATFALVLLCSAAAAAPKDRTLKRASLPDEPVEITEIKVKENRVQFWEQFPADDDWLSGITFTVKNTSERQISHLTLLIEQPISETFSLTIPVGAGDFNPLGQTVSGPAIAAPGKTVEIRLSEGRYRGFRDAVPTQYQFTPITQVTIHVQRVVFTDGTMWYKGMLHQRDPNNPRRWYPAPGEKERFLEKMRG